MTLSPGIAEQKARLRSDLRMGMAIVLEYEGEAVLVLAAETLKPARLSDLVGLARDAALTVTARRAETLHARPYDGDVARIRLPKGADAAWVRAIADPSADLMTPMKGPFLTMREGNADLHRAALVLCKQARLLPAAVIGHIENGADFANAHGLQVPYLVSSGDRLPDTAHLREITAARLPIEVSENACLHVFRPDDGSQEHYAIEIGRPDRAKPVLVRLHSACFTGDLLHSLKCDCGPQLRAALARIGEEKEGVLLYLNQEGRGIGLANKMRAYALQDQGFDTVEANHRLGFEDDERDFLLGANILSRLGFSEVRLMTNNPRKVDKLTEAGLKVSARVPLRVGRSALNTDYLDTKAKKSGHIL